AAEVVLLELVAPAPAQLLEHLAQAHELLAVAVLEAGLEHAAQGGVEVAVVQQVVGDLTEHVVGVELEADLRAVPARVAVAGRAHVIAFARRAGAVGGGTVCRRHAGRLPVPARRPTRPPAATLAPPPPARPACALGARAPSRDHRLRGATVSVTERDRRRLFKAFEETWGEEIAMII